MGASFLNQGSCQDFSDGLDIGFLSKGVEQPCFIPPLGSLLQRHCGVVYDKNLEQVLCYFSDFSKPQEELFVLPWLWSYQSSVSYQLWFFIGIFGLVCLAFEFGIVGAVMEHREIMEIKKS